ncbi:MAG: Mss4p nuclear export [Alyxoria varia]|nr:MAG: Mss4p nuclear export [Alyxoria varia]
MGKRKIKQADGAASSGESSADEEDTLDVSFEWFDPQEIDFHGIKQLLKQLLDADHELLDVSKLADLVLAQPLLGSTVKVPDDANAAKDNDPFAFLTVLNLWEHREKPEVKTLTQYLKRHAAHIPSLSDKLPSLLQHQTEPAPDTPEKQPHAQLGLILTERFINMPHEITPPMYTMLLEEIQWALEEKEPYDFTHYLILSKTYTQTPDAEHDGDGGAAEMADEHGEDGGDGAQQQQLKKKKAKRRKSKAGAAVNGGPGSAESGSFFFHPEDEALHKHAVGHGDFKYERADSEESRRLYQEVGVKPLGHMILIEAERFPAAVKDVQDFIGGGPVQA